VGGVVVALLGACQTGTDPADDGPTPSASAPAEPSVTSTPTEDPDESAEPGGPVVNGPNSITSPTPGETVSGPTVTVTGEGTAFEATLNYQVLVAGTDEVVLGPDHTMAGANGEIGPYAIELTLDPGEYTVQVWEPGMSDGASTEGPTRNLVEVTFTVA
jgi:hypothetical protein